VHKVVEHILVADNQVDKNWEHLDNLNLLNQEDNTLVLVVVDIVMILWLLALQLIMVVIVVVELLLV
jgi:hypothetical protein